jgi:hypothetical protein
MSVIVPKVKSGLDSHMKFDWRRRTRCPRASRLSIAGVCAISSDKFRSKLYSTPAAF